ncbi:lipocalin family protein [Flavobacteriaceae bacterium KMM 6897]|nr:lipocalin family protein [Flavobacteriaceae bacterium KMM 6897]MEB8345797.1 lipocalin family protein [Flavobacteriaceae bacterium KMM 6898]
MITRSFISLVIVALLGFSCSSDKDNVMGTSSIEGTWDVAELKVNDSNNQDLLFAKGIFDVLIAQDCDLLVLTFKADGTLITRSGVNDIEIDFNATSIPCPASFEEEDATWSLDGDQLTITDATGLAETATIQLNSSSLIVAGEDIEAESLTGTEIIFKRR